MPDTRVTITPPGAPALPATTLEALGVRAGWKAVFAHGAPDELTLNVPGSAVADGLEYQSRIQILLDGISFFHGVVAAAPSREKSGGSKGISLSIAGPWFWLRRVYEPTLRLRTGRETTPPYDYIYTDAKATHYTINRDPQTGLIIGSRAQIVQVLDFLLAQGAYFAYDAADIVDLPVLPVDALNETCERVILSQFNNYNVVCGFDHSQTPPRFYARQAGNCGSQTLTFKASPDPLCPTGLEITQLVEQQPTFVKVTFIRSVNGTPTFTSYAYPPDEPDGFFPLITTVPLNGFSSTTEQTRVTIEAVQISSLDWWKARIPKLANADEYDQLEIVAGSPTRDYPALANFVKTGAVAEWMNCTVAPDRVTVKLKWKKKLAAGSAGHGDVVRENEFYADIQATNLPVGNPDTELDIGGGNTQVVGGDLYERTVVSDYGENPGDFATLPQQIYEDLVRPRYAGTLPALERSYSGQITLGKLYNVTGVNCRPEWAAMGAMAQNLAVTVNNGSVEYNIRLGPNPWLTAESLVERLRAARQSYYTLRVLFGPNGTQQGRITLSAINAGKKTDEANPAHETKGAFAVLTSGNFASSLITVKSNSPPDPAMILEIVRPDGTPVLASNTGRVEARLKDALGNEIKFRVWRACKQDGTRGYVIALTSPFLHDIPGDPPVDAATIEG